MTFLLGSTFPLSLHNWRVYATGLSRTAAQAKETRLAANQFGCQAHHGGNDPDRPSAWAVYGFAHGGW